MENEYNMKLDFISLGIIMLIFVGFLIALYYYDQQSNVLTNTTQQFLNLF